MPTVLRVDGYRSFFFCNEGNEPPHIHVHRAENYAKFWLQPTRLATNNGYTSREISRISDLIDQYHPLLLEAWHEFFNR